MANFRNVGEELARAATSKEAQKILGDVRIVEPLSNIDEESALARRERLSHLGMKERYGKHLLWFLVAQMAVADAVFILYAALGVHWKISAQVMDVWLGATVVQVVAIVLVIVKHLFPSPHV